MNEFGKGRFHAYSGGSHPTGVVNPLALRALQVHGITSGDFRSKSWDEFAKADSPVMDFVFTVCNQAAGEACPFWPGQPVTAHWGVPDPVAFPGTGEQKERKFLDVAVTLKRRIELLLALPLHWLDSLALKRELKDIGLR